MSRIAVVDATGLTGGLLVRQALARGHEVAALVRDPRWTTWITTEVTMNSMFNLPHPGLTLQEDIPPAMNLQVSEAAAQLGVDRTTLSKVLNGRAAISLSMALRIERWRLDHGGAAEVWLAQQTAYDLWQARAAVNASKVLSDVKALKRQMA